MISETAFDDADLNGFVDGRIEPSRAAALAASLGSDPEAAARIDTWRRQTDSLRTMFASVLAEPVPVRLLPVAMPARDAPTARGRRARPLAGAIAVTGIGAALVGFALGALASLGTDGFGLLPARGPGAPAAPEAMVPVSRDLAARAAEAHRTFLADPSWPVELTAGDGAKLARWIGRRMGAALRVPDLGRQGWTLVGGRIVPGRRGPAALLVYADGADRLGLTVSRGDGGAPRVVAEDGDGDAAPVGVATWGDGEFGYALTSDRGRDWLARNAAPLRDRVKAQLRPGDEDAPPP